jgi:large subunit ribosomal protein L24
MTAIKKIKKNDMVKIISGANKGTTGKVEAVLNKQNAVRIEGVGKTHRKVKPSMANPQGGHKDIHMAIPISKVALVIDEKTGKTSRIGRIKNTDGKMTRVARQNNNKEIK